MDTPPTEPDAGDADLVSGDGYSVLGALRTIPADVDFVEIHTADLATARALPDLDEPTDAAGTRRLVQQLSGATDDDTGAPVYAHLVGVAEFAVVDRSSDAEEMYAEIRADLGWTVGDVDAYVSAAELPSTFTVVTGDIDADHVESSSFEPSGGGLFSVGDGADYGVDVAAATPSRPLGRPRHVALREPSLAMSLERDHAEMWAAGGFASVADLEPWATVATALDRHDVVSAVLVEIDGPETGSGIHPDIWKFVREQAITEPFDVLGVGWSVVDGEPTVHVAYHFADAAAAEIQTDRIEEMFTSGGSHVFNTWSADRWSHIDTTADGPVVTVGLRLLDERPHDVAEALFQSDAPFLYVTD